MVNWRATAAANGWQLAGYTTVALAILIASLVHRHQGQLWPVHNSELQLTLAFKIGVNLPGPGTGALADPELGGLELLPLEIVRPSVYTTANTQASAPAPVPTTCLPAAVIPRDNLLAGRTLLLPRVGTDDTAACVSGTACQTFYSQVSLATGALHTASWNSIVCPARSNGQPVPVLCWAPNNPSLVGCLDWTVTGPSIDLTLATGAEALPVYTLPAALSAPSDWSHDFQTTELFEITLIAGFADAADRVFIRSPSLDIIWSVGELWPPEYDWRDYWATCLVVINVTTTGLQDLTFATNSTTWTLAQVLVRPISGFVADLSLPLLPSDPPELVPPDPTTVSLLSQTVLAPDLFLWVLTATGTGHTTITFDLFYTVGDYYGAAILAVDGQAVTGVDAMNIGCDLSLNVCVALGGRHTLTAATGKPFTANTTLLINRLPTTALYRSFQGWAETVGGGQTGTLDSVYVDLPLDRTEFNNELYYYMNAAPEGADVLLWVVANGEGPLLGIPAGGLGVVRITYLYPYLEEVLLLSASDVVAHRFTAFTFAGAGQITSIQLGWNLAGNPKRPPPAVPLSPKILEPYASSHPFGDFILPGLVNLVKSTVGGVFIFYDYVLQGHFVAPIVDNIISPWWVFYHTTATLPEYSVVIDPDRLVLYGGHMVPYAEMAGLNVMPCFLRTYRGPSSGVDIGIPTLTYTFNFEKSLVPLSLIASYQALPLALWTIPSGAELPDLRFTQPKFPNWWDESSVGTCVIKSFYYPGTTSWFSAFDNADVAPRVGDIAVTTPLLWTVNYAETTLAELLTFVGQTSSTKFLEFIYAVNRYMATKRHDLNLVMSNWSLPVLLAGSPVYYMQSGDQVILATPPA